MSTPEIIYLIHGEYDGEQGLVWCDDPAPSSYNDPAEAVKYVRADTLPVVTDNGKVNVGLIAENERLQARVAELEAEEEGAQEAFGVIAEHNEALRKEVKRLEGGIKSWQQGYYSKEGSDNAG